MAIGLAIHCLTFLPNRVKFIGKLSKVEGVKYH